ncbi:hypothetical protein [Arthrobacter sp. zg-Y179]|uniref:hypothetical protein n=1 Tax=Arthrobacter sp. zg-Y179 TaxID=2894188 RepID=UPI001E3113A5|nr:hypothetical protein [Arthrobacter sp. zg-Y179]MCC9173805.1 hypothetical protein [Arthrobacter sp. zg-Y179]
MDEPVDALAKLNGAVDRAKRISTVQFPVVFVRRDGEDAPFLSKLMRGGRGGEVRLRLYLTLRMQATRHPYRLRARPARSLAAMLNLPDDTGPRQINAALKWLEKERLIRRDRQEGKPSEFTLLKPDGSGEEWTSRSEPRWVTIPIELWKNGWILRLNGRCLAVYVALRELTGGSGPEGGVMDGHRKAQYGMSLDTWTRATKELEDMGILTVKSEVYGDEDWDRRRRNRYRLMNLADLGSPSWY